MTKARCNKTVHVDIDTKNVRIDEKPFTADSDYGRGLAVALLRRYSSGDPMVFVPGLLVGNGAPSACRMTVADCVEGRLHVSNTTGDMPHRLATLGIEALVVTGKARNQGTVVYIEEGNCQILTMQDLWMKSVGDTVNTLRERFGRDCSITGTGPAGDLRMPLATLFMTYPEGIPRYSCSRSTRGDAAGHRNLKAIVVKSPKLFGADCVAPESFRPAASRISRIIRENVICGSALPGHGSITLMKILKEGREIPLVRQTKKAGAEIDADGDRINHTCSPVCVIGCLNRGEARGSKAGFFDIPEVAEVSAALRQCFGIDDFSLVGKIMTRTFALGLNATEFVFSANLYCKASLGREKEVTPEMICELLMEVEKGSLVGRVIGGNSQGVYRLYPEREDLYALVSKPSISHEKDFTVSLLKPESYAWGGDDMDLLYQEIFLLENLGLCIFTSFALLNNEEALRLMARLFEARTGVAATPASLLEYAAFCIGRELAFQRESASGAVGKSVPEFTKVLYRYFSA